MKQQSNSTQQKITLLILRFRSDFQARGGQLGPELAWATAPASTAPVGDRGLRTVYGWWLSIELNHSDSTVTFIADHHYHHHYQVSHLREPETVDPNAFNLDRAGLVKSIVADWLREWAFNDNAHAVTSDEKNPVEIRSVQHELVWTLILVNTKSPWLQLKASYVLPLDGAKTFKNMDIEKSLR